MLIIIFDHRSIVHDEFEPKCVTANPVSSPELDTQAGSLGSQELDDVTTYTTCSGSIVVSVCREAVQPSLLTT